MYKVEIIAHIPVTLQSPIVFGISTYGLCAKAKIDQTFEASPVYDQNCKDAEFADFLCCFGCASV